MHVPSQEIEWSCICVLVLSILTIFLQLFDWSLESLRQCGIFCFSVDYLSVFCFLFNIFMATHCTTDTWYINMCVRGINFGSISTIIRLRFRIVTTVWYFLLTFYDYSLYRPILGTLVYIYIYLYIVYMYTEINLLIYFSYLLWIYMYSDKFYLNIQSILFEQ